MKFLINTNKYAILLLSIIVLYGGGFALASIRSDVHGHSFGALQQDYLILKFGFAVLFAPLVETLVLQHWLIKTAGRYLSFRRDWQNRAGAILVSALAFAVLHWYSPFFMLAAFLAGLLLASVYSLFALRGDMNPVLAVFLVHFTNNFLNFMGDVGAHLI